MKIQNLIVLLLGLFSLTISRGERINEFREDATHVVVGEVTKVFKSDGEEYVGYVVRIQVEALEKGTGPAKGQHFYAEGFERKPHKGPGILSTARTGFIEVQNGYLAIRAPETRIITGAFSDIIQQGRHRCAHWHGKTHSTHANC